MLLTYEYYKSIFYWLYVIEYANFNSQANYVEDLTEDGYRQGGLGNGVTTWKELSWSKKVLDDFVKKSRSTQGLRSNPDSRIA